MSAGYATALEPYRVQVISYRLLPQGWPPGLRLRVAVLTDFHAHPRCMGEAEIVAVVARTNALAPDITVLLGDYGSQSPGPVPFERVAAILRGLVAPKGVYAIQGNHDWGDDREARRRGYGPTRAERALRGGRAYRSSRTRQCGSTFRHRYGSPVWRARRHRGGRGCSSSSSSSVSTPSTRRFGMCQRKSP